MPGEVLHERGEKNTRHQRRVRSTLVERTRRASLGRRVTAAGSLTPAPWWATAQLLWSFGCKLAWVQVCPSIVVGEVGVERDGVGDIDMAQLIEDLVSPLGVAPTVTPWRGGPCWSLTASANLGVPVSAMEEKRQDRVTVSLMFCVP